MSRRGVIDILLICMTAYTHPKPRFRPQLPWWLHLRNNNYIPWERSMLYWNCFVFQLLLLDTSYVVAFAFHYWWLEQQHDSDQGPATSQLRSVFYLSLSLRRFSVSQGCAGELLGRDPFSISDLSSGTLFLSLSGMPRHSPLSSQNRKPTSSLLPTDFSLACFCFHQTYDYYACVFAGWVWGVCVCVCVCMCGMLICFISALGSHEMGRHKLPIIIIISLTPLDISTTPYTQNMPDMFFCSCCFGGSLCPTLPLHFNSNNLHLTSSLTNLHFH